MRGPHVHLGFNSTLFITNPYNSAMIFVMIAC